MKFPDATHIAWPRTLPLQPMLRLSLEGMMAPHPYYASYIAHTTSRKLWVVIAATLEQTRRVDWSWRIFRVLELHAKHNRQTARPALKQ